MDKERETLIVIFECTRKMYDKAMTRTVRIRRLPDAINSLSEVERLFWK
jgi:hypothetical protein